MANHVVLIRIATTPASTLAVFRLWAAWAAQEQKDNINEV
jgi:hypothetical protein